MIATYQDLCNAVQAWANAPEVTQNVGNFITLAEAQINRRLTCREMWSFTNINLGCDIYQLPSDFLSVESIAGPWGKLRYLTPQMMDEQPLCCNDALGYVWYEQRRFYTVAGGALILNGFAPPPPPPMQGSPPVPPPLARMRYRRRVDPLAGANPCNWLLQAHPDVYLYGALAQTKGFLEDDARSSRWEDAFVSALEEIQDADKHTIADDLDMQTDAMGHHRNRDRYWGSL